MGDVIPIKIKDLNSQLIRVSDNGELEAVETLIEEGASVNFTGQLLNTPLSIAARAGHDKIARLLLDHGAVLPTSMV